MQYDQNHALLSTEIPELTAVRRGKVRDVYDLGDSILFVATDRISAFDCVMPNGIPGKGRVLAQVTLNWFKVLTGIKNHLITADVSKYPAVLQKYAADLEGRSMLVRKLNMLPVECIVRGYLTGSGWSSYQKTGKVCGIPLREGYQNASKLDEPIFTPTTKAEPAMTRRSPSRNSPHKSAPSSPTHCATPPSRSTTRPPNTRSSAASSSPTPNSSSEPTRMATSSLRTRSSLPTPPASGPWTPTRSARTRRPSTSSSCATGWTACTSTTSRPRRNSRRRSSRRPVRNTKRPWKA